MIMYIYTKQTFQSFHFPRDWMLIMFFLTPHTMTTLTIWAFQSFGVAGWVLLLIFKPAGILALFQLKKTPKGFLSSYNVSKKIRLLHVLLLWLMAQKRPLHGNY